MILDKIRKLCKKEAGKIISKSSYSKEDLREVDTIWDIVKIIDDYENVIEILNKDKRDKESDR